MTDQEDASPYTRGFVAAAIVIIEEAGGRVSRYDGTPATIYAPPIMASNGLVHDAMLGVLQG